MKVIDTQSDRETHYYTQYKVVELTSVTDADIEKVLNEWSRKGWNLDGIQFAMRDSSKRPAMAFIMLTRSAALEESGSAPARSRSRGRDQDASEDASEDDDE